MDIIKRNLPVFIIGALTFVIFIGIIILGQNRSGDNGPVLTDSDQQELIAEHTYTLGNENAPVVLVEFSDYECPACQYFQPIVRNLYRQYPNQLYIAYRHFPLPQHPQARNAAIAAQAAGSQGKFWEYSDILFENNTALERDDLIRYAETTGLDVEKFRQDLDNSTFSQNVSDDLATANRLRLNATPSFFLNGKLMKFTDVQDFQEQIIGAMGEVNPVQEEPQATPSESETNDQTGNKELLITYNSAGFAPQSTTGYVGEKLIIKNSTDQAITLEKPKPDSETSQATITVPAGENYEAVFDKSGTWEYKVKESGRFGAVTVYEKP